MKIESGAVVTSRKGVSGCERGKVSVISGKKKASVCKETDVVSSTRVMHVQNRHQKPLHL